MFPIVSRGLLSLVSVVFGSQATSAEIPNSLMHMVAARTCAFNTAHFEWLLDDSQTARYYASRYCGGDFLLWEYGDKDGCVDRYACGESHEHVYSPYGHLYTVEGQQWNYHEEGLRAILNDREAAVIAEQPDIRTFGLLPFFPRYDTHERVDAANFLETSLRVSPEVRFVEEIAPDGVVRVTAHYLTSQIIWHLDPEKDYQPILVEGMNVRSDGELEFYECMTEYQKVDGIWCVKSVESMDHRRALRQSVEVQYASFDRPDHPQKLTPAVSLGMVPWVSVIRRGAEYVESSPATPVLPEKFDGERSVSREEFERRLKEGSFPPSDEKRAMMDFRRANNYIPGAAPASWMKIESQVRSTPNAWNVGAVYASFSHLS